MFKYHLGEISMCHFLHLVNKKRLVPVRNNIVMDCPWLKPQIWIFQWKDTTQKKEFSVLIVSNFFRFFSIII